MKAVTARRVGIGLICALVVPASFRSTGAVLEAQLACITGHDGQPVANNQDALARLLAVSGPCPSDVLAFRERIRENGGTLATAFIGNRSFHNPRAGSFSLFEMVTGNLSTTGSVQGGEFFFGHFTAAVDLELILDQNPRRESLMIEAIAWDPVKGMYNFYELLGNGAAGSWKYAGDSGDILADTEFLHRARNGQQPFGRRLRCSGCHVNGGPIMKELAAPHNDWWMAERHLPLGGREFDTQIAAIARGFAGGEKFSANVKVGVEKLAASAQFKRIRAGRSLQEQLRPLFCPVEMNFESDPAPMDANLSATRMPSGILVDSRLAEGPLHASRADYDRALKANGSRFPEIDRSDADHAWLGPVKAASDHIAIRSLVDSALIDSEFVSDVLAVDFTNPALSPARCELLKMVPVSASIDWQGQFRQALAASSDQAAKELLTNFTDATRVERSHRERAAQFLGTCRDRLKTGAFVVSALRLLDQRRAEIAANEISKNSRGQILEPGFRVIFPEQDGTQAPGSLKLSDTCDITK